VINEPDERSLLTVNTPWRVIAVDELAVFSAIGMQFEVHK
jgi:hypothetical protein